MSIGKAAARRHHRRRRGRARHCLAARPRAPRSCCSTAARPAPARAMRRPACLRPAPKPSPARRIWSRSAATARRAGRLSPRSCCSASGIDVELRREGTLVLALTADDQADAWRIIWNFSRSSICRWNGFPPRRRAPARAASRRQDRRRACSARRIIRSTTASSRRRCASPRRRPAPKFTSTEPVKEISVQGGRATGIVLEDGTSRAGRSSWCSPPAPGRAASPGLPPDRRPPVRPVKGQMLALRMDAAAPLLNHVLWAPGAYLVPRRDGRLIVGAHGRGERL